MAFIKIENGVIVQKQPYAEDGFVEAPEDVVCGYIHDGEKFTAPVIPDKILSYEQLRAKEYPPIGDQLDAIWKELNYRRLNGETLVQDADDMLGKILAVKQKYPKPVEK